VLFSDIRGFTRLSEHLTPREVVDRLNEYLQAMTDAVFRHDGAVDKYMGDCIMALFGVPAPCTDHAQRAVAAALDMQAALLEMQAKWRAEGLPLIDVGIGVSTGQMVAGNVGSEQRLDFTVIGDVVNLAQRLESLNKELGTRILISEFTFEQVRNDVRTRGPLTVAIRGRGNGVVAYELLGWAGSGRSTSTP
jgi:adenylate cyclase